VVVTEAASDDEQEKPDADASTERAAGGADEARWPGLRSKGERNNDSEDGDSDGCREAGAAPDLRAVADDFSATDAELCRRAASLEDIHRQAKASVGKLQDLWSAKQGEIRGERQGVQRMLEYLASQIADANQELRSMIRADLKEDLTMQAIDIVEAGQGPAAAQVI